jgi:cytochrome P450
MAAHRTATVEPLDLTSVELVADPYPEYARLRAAGGVHYSPQWDVWYVTGYEQCHAVLSAADAAGQPLLRALQAAVLRGARSWRPPALTPPTAVQAEQRAAGRRTTGRALGSAFVDALWARFAADCGRTAQTVLCGDRVDLVRNYAIPLCTALLADLMAVPAADLPAFRAWAESGYAPVLDDAARRTIVVDIRRLLAGQAVERLRRPAEDFIGQLAANPGALPGERSALTAHLEFVLGTGLMISLVTHQGLVLSFSTLLRSLLDRPDQYELLRADRGLIAGAVEEGLRYDASTQALGRLVRRPLRVGDTELPAGSLIVVFTGSANRDQAQWPDADSFDVTRNMRSAARHLTFGIGATSCLGAAMSRRALGYLLGAVVSRVAVLHPADGAVPFPEFMTRGFTSLPVTPSGDPFR